MNPDQAIALGSYVRAARKAKHLSASALAAPAGVDPAQILRLERGEVAAPQATVLGGIVKRLQLPVSDLFALAGYPRSRDLPSVGPYLRVRYPQLTEALVEAIVTLVESVPSTASPTEQRPRVRG